MNRIRRPFVALLLLAAVSCQAPEPFDPEAHIDDIATWQVLRLAELIADDSWLTLIDYHWLADGETLIGAGIEEGVTTPRGPDQVGRFVRTGQAVVFIPEPGVPVIAETASGTAPVPPEGMDGGMADEEVVFRLGSISWYVRHFQNRPAVRLRDNEAPGRWTFPGLTYFPVDPEWRIEASFEPYDPPKEFPVAVFTGGEEIQTSPGAAVFELAGETYRLDVTDQTDSTYFVIFSDQTSGDETYGGGRYVWFDRPNEEGHVVVDFNKAYNPPCVFTKFATCPLPPMSHRLDTRVAVGEQMYTPGT